MQSVDLLELQDLARDLNELLIHIPEARRKLHEDIAEIAKKEVDTQILASGINDANNKIRGWQEARVGSGGGYAAVSAVKGVGLTGDNSPGAITNYLESGHRIRPPSGQAKRYEPAIKTPYVEGRHFYEEARYTAEAKVIRLVEQYTEELASRIEGGLS